MRPKVALTSRDGGRYCLSAAIVRQVTRHLAPLVADVHAILTRPDGRILMMVRANTGYRDGEAGLPSGHLDPNETVEEATVRELKEETGILAQPCDLVFAHVMHRHTVGEPGSRVSFFFTATRWEGEPVNAEPHKCAGLLWVDPGDLHSFSMTPVIGYIADALAAIRAGVRFSVNGW